MLPSRFVALRSVGRVRSALHAGEIHGVDRNLLQPFTSFYRFVTGPPGPRLHMM